MSDGSSVYTGKMSNGVQSQKKETTPGTGSSTNHSLLATQLQHKKQIFSYSDAINAIIDDVKCGSGKDISVEEAQKMQKGVMGFSGEDYYNIRAAYQNPQASNYDRERLDALDAYLSGAPKWVGKVYRGISVTQDVANDILSKPFVDMKGPSSWSSDMVTAEAFATKRPEDVSVLFVLGENKSGVSITHLAAYDGMESEVTAPSGVCYHIDSVRQSVVMGKQWVYVFVSE